MATGLAAATSKAMSAVDLLEARETTKNAPVSANVRVPLVADAGGGRPNMVAIPDGRSSLVVLVQNSLRGMLALAALLGCCEGEGVD